MPRANRRPASLPLAVFPQEAMLLAQEAVKRLEAALEASAERVYSSKWLLAQESIQQLHGKLTAMSQSQELWCLTGLDYNEKLLLGLAMQLYTLDLEACPPDEQWMKQLTYCQQIRAFCAGLVLAKERARHA